ncbi:PD-(D/E)XK nuclease family protein [Actinoplanes sp. NPDC051859]|uniref:RecB family exonuclease n=1 Tax=Actinoplanes sp. NPDC051859 TaxID=3363909 RepID=UPI00379AD406
MTAETVPHRAAPGAPPTGPEQSTAEPQRHPGPSLSPSRAADFKTCPLLFRFRTIDRLPEQPSRDQARGTLVHAVLERLFDLPAPDRTPAAAAALVAPQWDRLVAEEPELAALFAADDDGIVPVSIAEHPLAADPTALADPASTSGAHRGPPPSTTRPSPPASSAGTDPATLLPADPGASPTAAKTVGNPNTAVQGAHAETFPGMPEPVAADRLAAFLASTADLLDGYFAVEDPQRLEPAERESLVSTLVDDELLIRGYIDRLDVSPAGDLRVVDYKTGGAPREAFEGRALFQLKFYALVLWRTRGVVPRVLRLLYLKDAEVCDYSPDAEELARFERTLVALSHAIERAKQDRDFRPKPSRLCGWCHHQRVCPEFGGTPPPYPSPRDEELSPQAEVSMPAPRLP